MTLTDRARLGPIRGDLGTIPGLCPLAGLAVKLEWRGFDCHEHDSHSRAADGRRCCELRRVDRSTVQRRSARARCRRSGWATAVRPAANLLDELEQMLYAGV